MSKIGRATLALASLSKTIGFLNVWKLAKDFQFEIISCPKEKKILVLAPHPDDEAFGAGGTLLKLGENQAQISVLYLTSIPVRQQEAQKAADILGVSQQIFWQEPDGKLAFSEKLAQKLALIIKDAKPEAIFLPTFFDSHWDHLATNRILIGAAKYLPSSRDRLKVYAYQVWQPGPFNRLVDISTTLQSKEKAIAVFASQLKDRDYKKAIVCLNQYFGVMYGAGEAAEAYLATNLKNYCQLFKVAYGK